jgi:hypothetical protein
MYCSNFDRLCGLVVNVTGYTSRGPRFDFRRYQIFWELVGLERGPPILVSTIEGATGRKSSSSGLEKREYGLRYPPRWPRDTLYPQEVGTNFAEKRRPLVDIDRSRTKAKELLIMLL